MRDKHGDQYDDDDPIIESQARPVGEPTTCISTAELAALRQRAEKAENRERQLRVEIKTLRRQVMIEELKAAVESVRKSGPTDERQHFYQAEVARAFLAKYGPALIAAVELAEATKAMEDGLEGPDGFGDMNLVRDYKRAMDAFRAAKKENSHES